MSRRHEKRNRITNRWARMNGLMDYRPERIPLLVAVQPYKPDGTPLIVVSETRIGSVIRRQFAPLITVYGLIADAIASERTRAGTPTTTTQVRKPNGHRKPSAIQATTLSRAETILTEIEHPAHQSTSSRPNRYSKYPKGADQDEPEKDQDEPRKKSWKAYRAKQWRGGNRWSCRQEALALTAW